MTDANEIMREAELAEIRARADAATEGDWLVAYGGGNDDDGFGIKSRIANKIVAEYWPPSRTDYNPADGAFIAHARRDIPRLLSTLSARAARISALEADCAAMTKERDEYRPYYDAIRAAHNGYDPAMRAANPDMREPKTPSDALTDLEREHDAMLHSEIDLRLKAEAELCGLREIVGKLPLTADGVPIIPGTKVWVTKAIDEGTLVREFDADSLDSRSACVRNYRGFPGGAMADLANCYSTRAAALTALAAPQQPPAKK